MFILICIIVLLIVIIIYLFRNKKSFFSIFRKAHRWVKYDAMIRNANKLYYSYNNPQEALRILHQVYDNGPLVYKISAAENINAIKNELMGIADLANASIRVFNIFDGNDYMDDNTINILFPMADDAHRRYMNEAELNDSQNVHDTTVQNHLAATIANLKQNTGPVSAFNIDEINDIIVASSVDAEKKKKAMNALKYLSDTNEYIVRHNMNERDGLALMVEYINKNKIGEDKKNALDSLVLALADMYEDNQIVCATGRFSRIFGALDGLDNNVSLRPEFAIKQEMLNRSGKLRQEFSEDWARREGTSVEAIQMRDDFDDKLYNYLSERFKKDYQGLMSVDKIQAEINSWKS